MNADNEKKDGQQSNEGGHKNQIEVQIRYQNETVSFTINKNESVQALLVEAIKKTGNDTEQKDRFQLKLGGTVLDPNKKVSDYPIIYGTLLNLNLLAGGGGTCEI